MQCGDALPTCLKNGTKEIEAAYIKLVEALQAAGLSSGGSTANFANRRGTPFPNWGAASMRVTLRPASVGRDAR